MNRSIRVLIRLRRPVLASGLAALTVVQPALVPASEAAFWADRRPASLARLLPEPAALPSINAPRPSSALEAIPPGLGQLREVASPARPAGTVLLVQAI
ncbi:MAG: hypothetical protein JO102_02550, partial [Elusimicrobia bacterium]|nr:hypothetical protein [Elusimicrobiota bacterium]